MSLKFTRKQDAHGNRGFSLHLMKVVDWPTGLNDAMSDASSNAGERYCIQTFRATGEMDLAIQAHQQGRPILERPAEPSQAQPGYVPGMPVATGTPVPQAPPPVPNAKTPARLLRLLRVLWVLCLVRHGVTMFSSRCRIFSSRCPSLHSMDGTNNSGHRCHHKKIPGSNVPNRILSNGSGTAVNVVIIAVEISSEVEDMTMTPEADETTSVGLGFTVSASNSQFSRHRHGNYLI